MALVLVLGTLAYAVACSTTLKRPYLETKKLCRRTITVMTAAVMAVAVLIVMAKLPDGGFAGQFKLDSGNQITQEQVDAFENGQISLLKEVDDALLQVENPYDWGMRNDSGAKAEWDHVFYDGKYYSYYGIAPVVLLYLPYHKLTGHYCSTNLSILLFSLVGLLFLAMAYLAFVKRWCKTSLPETSSPAWRSCSAPAASGTAWDARCSMRFPFPPDSPLWHWALISCSVPTC